MTRRHVNWLLASVRTLNCTEKKIIAFVGLAKTDVCLNND